MVEPISALIALIATVISAANLYIAGKPSSADRKRNVCKSLSALHESLLDIANTGNEIGAKLAEQQLTDPNPKELADVIHLLETQKSNLQQAQRIFDTLTKILSIKSQNLGQLHIHLGGKKNRIDVLYSSANDVMQRLESRKAPWEVSQEIDQPTSIEAVQSEINESGQPHGPLEIQTMSDPATEEDPDFQRLVDAAPELKRFVDEHCAIEDF